MLKEGRCDPIFLSVLYKIFIYRLGPIRLRSERLAGLHFFEDDLQNLNKVAGVFRREDHWWLELQHVAVGSVGAEQNTLLLQPRYDVLRLLQRNRSSLHYRNTTIR